MSYRWIQMLLILALLAPVAAAGDDEKKAKKTDKAAKTEKAAKKAPEVIALRNAKVMPAAGRTLRRGTVLIKDGKIEAVGDDVPVPEKAEVVDCTGKVITPGFIPALAWNIGVASAGRGFTDQEVDLVGLDSGRAPGFVCRDLDEALEALDAIMVQRRFGDAGDQVLVEECLTGEELSLLALTDGRTIVPLEGSRDYKRALDGDKGPNTGGMGAFSPSPPIEEKIWSEIEHRILVPMVHAIRREGHPYVGLIYLGIMLTPTGPKLLEVNVRFGDPETQPLMMRLKGDLLEIMLATIEKRLDEVLIEWDTRASVCVVMASKGYPGSYKTEKEILGLDALRGRDDVAVFHAGTERIGGRVYTSGGRVLGVTALGENREKARKKAYEAVREITFEGAQYRKDIAAIP